MNKITPEIQMAMETVHIEVGKRKLLEKWKVIIDPEIIHLHSSPSPSPPWYRRWPDQVVNFLRKRI